MFRPNTEIDKSLLHNGMELKNWKALCELQNWKAPNGKNNRNTQEKSLNQVCSWHKQGQKIIVDEVFEFTLVREDNRQDLELTELKEVMERQVIRRLAKQYNTVHYDIFGNEVHNHKLDLNLSLTDWFKELGLVNENYIHSKRYPKEMHYLLDSGVTRKEFDNILNNSHSTLKRWLGDVFKKLSSRRTIVGVEECFQLKLHNNNKKTKEEYKYIYQNATHGQIKFIKACEGIILEEYNTTLRDVLNGHATIGKDVFYSKVKAHIRKVCRMKDLQKVYDESISRLITLESYFPTVNVSLNPFTINKSLERIKDSLEDDLQVLDVLQQEIEQNDGDISFIELANKIDDKQKCISDTTINRLKNSAIERMKDTDSNNVSNTINLLHSPNAKITSYTDIQELRREHIGSPNPFNNLSDEEQELLNNEQPNVNEELDVNKQLKQLEEYCESQGISVEDLVELIANSIVKA